MLYNLLKWLFYYASTGYFRNIAVKGADNIPKKEPVIFAVNHASAFMDPIVVAVFLKRRMYFLTRGESFNNPISRFFFKHLNMIPVYRPETMPGESHKNEEVFETCFQHLGKGRCLLIFPEGNSRTERRLRPLKTGTARIALGANQYTNYDVDVKIIPIGINYSNPHRFQSDLYISIGEPISSAAYNEAFLANPKKTSGELTGAVEEAMKKQLVIIEDESLDELVSNIERIYKHEALDKKHDAGAETFLIQKDIVEVVQHFHKHDADRVWRVNLMMQQYNYHLNRFGLRDELIKGSGNHALVRKHLTFLIVALPLFIPGYIFNILPYKFATFLIKKIGAREDFEGSIKLAVGMFTFLAWYIGFAVYLSNLTNVWLGVLTAVALYPLGLFTLHYLKIYLQVRGTIRFVFFFLKKGKIITRLMTERQAIINELDAARKEYFSPKKTR